MRFRYIKIYDVLNDKESTGIPAVHGTEVKEVNTHDKRPVTAPEFIFEQGKDLYCRQASLRVGLTCSKFN